MICVGVASMGFQNHLRPPNKDSGPYLIAPIRRQVRLSLLLTFPEHSRGTETGVKGLDHVAAVLPPLTPGQPRLCSGNPGNVTLRASLHCNAAQMAIRPHSKNQQPSEQPPNGFSLSILKRLNHNKSFVFWCPEGDLNPHDPFRSADFKSAASADFAIRARTGANP